MKNKLLEIFIADDDIEDLELIEEAILDVEPTVEIHKFTNGQEVMEALNSRLDSELPCLIILDYNMPEMNGWELLASIKNHARYATIPKIVLSTSNAPLHVQKCMDNGAMEYIVKPNDMKELHYLSVRLLNYCTTAD